jgi:putative sigma-54 modulation protein
MDVVVRGKNRSVPDRLESVTRTKATKIARFTHDAGRVEVDYSEVHTARQDARQLCEITVHLKRHFLKAHATAGEPETALDLALGKVEQQVARLKDKRVRGRRAGDGHNGHNGQNGRSATGDAGADSTVPPADDDAALDGLPRIVKTKRFAAKPMDPEEAALQMELLGHAFFLFTNTETGHAAVLYRRADGDLGLIDTHA